MILSTVIKEEAFERMKNDPEYENYVLNRVRSAYSVSSLSAGTNNVSYDVIGASPEECYGYAGSVGNSGLNISGNEKSWWKKRRKMEADLTIVFKYVFGIDVSVGNISCLMCNRWAFVDAVKAANPKWEPGQPFNPSILDSVTRKSVESTLVKSGNTFVKKPSSGRWLFVVCAPWARSNG